MVDHYFSRKPTSAIAPRLLRTTVSGIPLRLVAGGGVFSGQRIDAGTVVLLEFAQLPEGKVLDLGCGYGVVGIWVKRKHPSLEICMSDVNERAVTLAKQNARANGVSADIRTGDGLLPWEGIQFSSILLNPPQHAGKEICFRLMQEAHAHLAVGGTLQLVIRRNKGGKSFSAEMERVFGNVHEIGKAKGYGVYVSRKA